jgi:hypothetical protein
MGESASIELTPGTVPSPLREQKELSTRYFTRFYIPLILSILAILFLVVLLTMATGLPEKAAINFASMRRANSNT